MKPSQVKHAIERLLDSNVAIFLWGSPGIGKSSLIKQIAAEHDLACIDLRLSLLDPTDLKGIPFFDSKSQRALWASPSFLPHEGKGILFLDEINAAPPSVQASAYQLILDRAVGEYTLPKGWKIIAAGNNEDDRGITYKLPAPLANRFIHLHMQVDPDEWISWGFANGIDTRILAFIRYKNDALFAFEADQKSFATPRSWEFVDKILASNLGGVVLLESVCGAIGETLGIEFLNFMRVFDKLPDIDAILKGTAMDYPQDEQTLYALSALLVHSYLQAPTQERLESLLNYLLSMQPEFSVMTVRQLQQSGVDMLQSKTFEKWVDKFSYLLE